MIKPYAVTIVRTVVTTITVDAENKEQARSIIDEYGCVEATSDMHVRDETVMSKITHVRLITRGST